MPKTIGFSERKIAKRIEELKSKYPQNLDAYLSKYEIDRQDIYGLIGTQFGEPERYLFISTIVNGLAGAASDLDVVVVTPEYEDVLQMPSHMYLGNRRLGVQTFDEGKLQQTMDRLRSATEADYANLMSHLNFGPNLQLNDVCRLVLAVDSNGDMPYVDNLNNMAKVVACTSFASFRRHLVYLKAADRAGESKGVFGYGVNALIFLKNMLMALTGDIGGGDKWILQRWCVYSPVDPTTAETDFMQRVGALWQLLRQGLSNNFDTSNKDHLVSELSDLYEIAASDLGIEDADTISVQLLDRQHQNLKVLDGLFIESYANNQVHFSQSEDGPSELSISGISDMSGNQAKDLLSRFRSNKLFVNLPIGDISAGELLQV